MRWAARIHAGGPEPFRRWLKGLLAAQAEGIVAGAAKESDLEADDLRAHSKNHQPVPLRVLKARAIAVHRLWEAGYAQGDLVDYSGIPGPPINMGLMASFGKLLECHGP